MTEKLDVHAIEMQIKYGIMPDEIAHRLIPKLIARIRALESASQPGSGEADIEDKRALFESICSPSVLARGKYTQQDYDRTGTQAAWEVFQLAWPVIFAAGQRAAPAAGNGEAKGEQ